LLPRLVAMLALSAGVASSDFARKAEGEEEGEKVSDKYDAMAVVALPHGFLGDVKPGSSLNERNHSEAALRDGVADAIRQAVAELAGEVERLQASKCLMPTAAACVKEWESNHQLECLTELGLADEFPFGCDSIHWVAESLIGSRAERDRLKAELADVKAENDRIRERYMR
jgi:hypothetical protein